MVEQVKSITIDEFVRLYESEGPFELINGERFVMSPPIAGHGNTASNLFLELGNHLNQHQLGRVFLETAFVLVDVPGWVKGSRVPDLMFYSAERLNIYQIDNPDWKSKPFILVPDLAIEIVSPTDRYSDVQDKVEQYLIDGVQDVWVLDPQRIRVTVHLKNSNQQTILLGEDILSGGEIIPDFEIVVAKIFA